MEEVRTTKYKKEILKTDLGQDFKDLEECNQLQLNKKILKWKNVLAELTENSSRKKYIKQEKIPNPNPKGYDDDWMTDAKGHWIFRDVLDAQGNPVYNYSTHNPSAVRHFLDLEFHTFYKPNAPLRRVVSNGGYANDFNRQLFTEYLQTLKDNINKAVSIYNAREIELMAKHKEDARIHQNTEVECGCGGHYSIRNKLKHFATSKHEKWIGTQELPEDPKPAKKETPKSKEIDCGCGGHYSVGNKLKHFATGKHTKWEATQK